MMGRRGEGSARFFWAISEEWRFSLGDAPDFADKNGTALPDANAAAPLGGRSSGRLRIDDASVIALVGFASITTWFGSLNGQKEPRLSCEDGAAYAVTVGF